MSRRLNTSGTIGHERFYCPESEKENQAIESVLKSSRSDEKDWFGALHHG